jgi:hypothetical protein
MRIEELARVVSVIACLLEPAREVSLIEPLSDELGVSSCDSG